MLIGLFIFAAILGCVFFAIVVSITEKEYDAASTLSFIFVVLCGIYPTSIGEIMFNRTTTDNEQLAKIKEICKPFLGIENIQISTVTCKNGYTFEKNIVKKDK